MYTYTPHYMHNAFTYQCISTKGHLSHFVNAAAARKWLFCGTFADSFSHRTLDHFHNAFTSVQHTRLIEGVPVTVAFVGLTTFWQVDGVFTLDWRAKGGLWRNNYESRVCKCMWLTDYGSTNAAHGRHGTWPPANCTKGVLLTVPKRGLFWKMAFLAPA